MNTTPIIVLVEGYCGHIDFTATRADTIDTGAPHTQVRVFPHEAAFRLAFPDAPPFGDKLVITWRRRIRIPTENTNE